MKFELAKPGTVLIEPLRPSGLTDGGLYVIDQDSAPTTMMVRVVAKHRSCQDAVVGEVYIVSVYRYDAFFYDGEKYYIMLEADLEAQLEGYDAA